VSTMTVSAAEAAPRSPERRARPLEPVAPIAERRRRPRVLYGIVAVAGAVAIGAAQMGMSILTTQGSYELSDLSRQQRDLTYQKQILTDDVAGLSSPQYLAANAAALGMVINESPSYLRLSDGAVLGSGAAAAYQSAIDALGRSSVPNALIADTPLVTAPDATIQGAPAAPPTTEDGAAVAEEPTPPAITDGLPVPATH
jgi:hypothetical protein